MAKIGGFDPGLGIQPLRDGLAEIGRANLPGAARLLPESIPDRAGVPLFGKITDSALLEGFAAYFALDLRHRELLAPDAFFEALEGAAESFAGDGEGEGGDGRPGEGPLAAAARALAEVLADRSLCETLRNLVLRA